MLFFPPSVHSWALRPTELSEWPDNLAIATNVVEAARRSGGGRLLVGSSVIYPRLAPQPALILPARALRAMPIDLNGT